MSDTPTMEQVLELKFEVRALREKAEQYDRFGERIARCEAYDQTQDKHLERMEARLNELSERIAEQSVNDLLKEERDENRKQAEAISALANEMKTARRERSEARNVLAGIKDALAASSDDTMARKAEQIVINVENKSEGGTGGSGGQGGNSAVDMDNVSQNKD